MLLGGLLTIVGAFWSGIESSQKDALIIDLQKENQIITEQTLNTITGGSSWIYFDVGFRWEKERLIPNKFGLPVKFVGNYPLSDVKIQIHEIQLTSQDSGYSSKALISDTHIPLITGNLFHNVFMPIIDLSNKDQSVYYQIDILSRNGHIVQFMFFERISADFWSLCTRAVRFSPLKDGKSSREILFERIDPQFPKEKLPTLPSM